MNCLQFRRKLLEDPRCREPDFRRHGHDCAACQREFERVQAFEASLREAIHVEPPAGLEERILRAQRRASSPTEQPAPAPAPRRYWPAIAAGIVMLFGATLLYESGWRGTPHGPQGLETTVLNHIQDELPHLHEVRDVPAERLARLIAQLGGELKTPLRHVNFAGKCQMRKYPGAHLVLAGEKGPVTVLIMPGEKIPAARRFRSERFDGELMPIANGSVAVVGERNEDVGRIARRVAQSIRWRI